MAGWLKKIGRYLAGSLGIFGANGRHGRRSRRTAAKRRVRKPKAAPKRTPGKKRKTSKKKPRRPVREGKYVGRVTHFFSGAEACALRMEKGELKIGDKIHIKGTSTNLKMKVRSIQINRIPVPSGRAGEEIGIGVASRVRENDEVYIV